MPKLKGKTVLIIVIVGVLIITLIVLLNNYFKSKPVGASINNQGGTNPIYIPTPNVNQANNPSCPPEFPLQFGSSNDYIGQLQNYLIKADSSCLPNGADGVWGNEMEACIQSVLQISKIDCYTYFQVLGLS